MHEHSRDYGNRAYDGLPEFCLKGGGGGCRGPLSGDPELLETPKAPEKFFGLN